MWKDEDHNTYEELYILRGTHILIEESIIFLHKIHQYWRIILLQLMLIKP
jgi:hypothetical protein